MSVVGRYYCSSMIVLMVWSLGVDDVGYDSRLTLRWLCWKWMRVMTFRWTRPQTRVAATRFVYIMRGHNRRLKASEGENAVASRIRTG